MSNENVNSEKDIKATLAATPNPVQAPPTPEAATLPESASSLASSPESVSPLESPTTPATTTATTPAPAPVAAPALSSAPAPYFAQYPPTQSLRRFRMVSFLKKALSITVLMLLIASAAYFGGYLANRDSSTVDNRDSSSRYQDLSEQYNSQNLENDETETQTETQVENQVLFAPSDVVHSSKRKNIINRTMTTDQVAAAVRDSVVEIKTEYNTSSLWIRNYVAEGAGSGVIISEDGYVITNNHVIDDVATITVRLVDGREYPATLIATDVKADIAVLKIDDTGLTYAIFGDSSNLVIGESALAVGNPLGELGGTVTSGIISALDREINVEGEIMTLLQTDAAVNPGNSGGGLFNMNAELIGIVNAKSSGLSIEGLAFAIPSNVAKAVATDLIIHGYVRGRIDLGIELHDVQSYQTARWYGYSGTGLFVRESYNEYFQRGDKILSINGISIADMNDYNQAMQDYGIGDTVTIRVERRNTTISIDVVLTEWKPLD
ncbi:MAG: trypsin-like peptidase domain-containing protein [Oscillospiraceae bacterium]|nr:trypsin-like peptidase domain-containing protein [Oscillospiraceae bacterium]